MEYVYLILQILFALGTVFFKTNDRYLVEYDRYHKGYLIVELIAQSVCIVANIVLIFVLKDFMVYVLIMHILLMSLILILYSLKAKKIYFNELTGLIKENDLLFADAEEIRRHLLKKYERLFFIDDIKKCLRKINNTEK